VVFLVRCRTASDAAGGREAGVCGRHVEIKDGIVDVLQSVYQVLKIVKQSLR